ncbi:MAG: hypothetical protein MR489_08180 [Prevotella sp.]|nr:hypothetical protein [Prevotella sp.]
MFYRKRRENREKIEKKEKDRGRYSRKTRKIIKGMGEENEGERRKEKGESAKG